MRRFIVGLFAIVASLNALAWGGLGHRTVAEIAERNLTPKAKANIEIYKHRVWIYFCNCNHLYDYNDTLYKPNVRVT